jgi:acetyltransferase-like isoleucine patch superfamily enzyme
MMENSNNLKYGIEIGNDSLLGKNHKLSSFVNIGKNCIIGSDLTIGFNSKIGNNVKIGDRVFIGDNSIIENNVTIESDTIIENNVTIGYSRLSRKKGYFKEFNTTIGAECIIRSGSVVYHACLIGNNSWIGNYTIIRENTIIGNNTTFGSHIMCEGYSEFGNNVKIYSFCELGGNMIVEDYVFIGPGTTTANNPKPLMGTDLPTNFRWSEGNQRVADLGPTLRKGVKIGIGSILLAEIEVGQNSLIAAGSVVTKSVPSNTVALGVPARQHGLLPDYEQLNKGLK